MGSISFTFKITFGAENRPSTGFQATVGTPSLYLSPGRGEIVGDRTAVTDTLQGPGPGA